MIINNLHSLLQKISYKEIKGKSNILISGIQTDSRKVLENFMFIAVKGTATNGHDYIEKAIALGAKAIVCEEIPEKIYESVCYIIVDNSAFSCGLLLKEFYNIDFSQLKLIGITGTNGKTTTVTLLYKLFTKLAYKCGLLSTVRVLINGNEFEATHTTPDTISLYDYLYKMQESGCEYCFMEVSSHALHQNRIAGLEFTAAIFSNITQDHLDYHKTFAEYIKAKKILFDNLSKSAFAIINSDDKNSSIMIQNCKAKSITYSLKSFADYKCKVLETTNYGMLLQIDRHEVFTKFLGHFNAYNILSVYTTAVALDKDPQTVLEIISSLQPADGRLEFFTDKNGKTAIVDYAHTPDALENVLKTLQKQCTEETNIITVFGAGGDRDTTKRPLMGKIAAQLSNRIIITSDNPRSEEPEVIAKDIYAGILPEDAHKVLTILDRKEAIKTACMLAQNTDFVLVAGKGHEDYQIIKGVKHHFDDREIIKELFKL